MSVEKYCNTGEQVASSVFIGPELNKAPTVSSRLRDFFQPFYVFGNQEIDDDRNKKKEFRAAHPQPPGIIELAQKNADNLMECMSEMGDKDLEFKAFTMEYPGEAKSILWDLTVKRVYDTFFIFNDTEILWFTVLKDKIVVENFYWPQDKVELETKKKFQPWITMYYICILADKLGMRVILRDLNRYTHKTQWINVDDHSQNITVEESYYAQYGFVSDSFFEVREPCSRGDEGLLKSLCGRDTPVEICLQKLKNNKISVAPSCFLESSEGVYAMANQKAVSTRKFKKYKHFIYTGEFDDFNEPLGHGRILSLDFKRNIKNIIVDDNNTIEDILKDATLPLILENARKILDNLRSDLELQTSMNTTLVQLPVTREKIFDEFSLLRDELHSIALKSSQSQRVYKVKYWLDEFIRKVSMLEQEPVQILLSKVQEMYKNSGVTLETLA